MSRKDWLCRLIIFNGYSGAKQTQGNNEVLKLFDWVGFSHQWCLLLLKDVSDKVLKCKLNLLDVGLGNPQFTVLWDEYKFGFSVSVNHGFIVAISQ